MMPVHLRGNDLELRLFRAAVDSIKNQTDPKWLLVMVDDFSNDQKVYDVIDQYKVELQDRLHVIYSERNCGAGATRNKGVLYAAEIGAPRA